ncbi:MAG: ABC-ATPase domain-containing protein [Candidatus Latescibacterota bacterium]
MNKSEDLIRVILSLNGKRAEAYRELAGEYDYDDFILVVDYIPDNPSKQSSRIRARVPLDAAKYPYDVFNTKSREIGARDFLIRSVSFAAAKVSKSAHGIRGGKIVTERPGQEIIENTALVMGDNYIEARFSVDLPLKGDKIPGNLTVELFGNIIPKIIKECLFFKNLDGDGLAEWIETNEDADAVRSMLDEMGLVAFVADGSLLPRNGYGDPRPLFNGAVPFISPDELAVTLQLPNAGEVRGMGIPKGITLITGGGQRKSTLIEALALGVYNHIPKDGRQLVITAGDAVAIRAEEGRRIENVDISPFISSHEPGKDPKHYSTPFSSPAVSQAANIMEAVEIGTSLLIIDEATSAADIMDQDARMQKLFSDSQETVTPLVDILPFLKTKKNISTIIVSNSAGDFLEIADTVVSLKEFQPLAVTAEAKSIVKQYPSGRTPRAVDFPQTIHRYPLGHSLEPFKSPYPEGSKSFGRGYIQYGDEFIDCTKVVQLITYSQGKSISRSISLLHRLIDSSKSLSDAVEKVMDRVNTIGLDTLSGRLMGDLSAFRAYELAAAINRMRKLKVQ